jgi:dUTP pyrophosphatase
VLEVRIKLLSPSARLPERRTPGAAGFDLAASEATTVPARGFAVVSTGLAIQLPPDCEAQVRPRSGLAARHGIGILNSPGTIDPDYRGEIRIILFNVSGQHFQVNPGDRIAQLVFCRNLPVRLTSAAELSDTKRGDGGFGHTGQ